MALEGKAAAAAVDALKSYPVALALVFINVLFLIAGTWMFHELIETSRHNREATYKLLTQMVNCQLRPP